MDENPYKSPRTFGYREVREGEPQLLDPPPVLTKTPWMRDRDAIIAVAAVVFFVGAAAILIGIVRHTPSPW